MVVCRLLTDAHPGEGYFDFPKRHNDTLYDAIGLIHRDGEVIDMSEPHFNEEVYVSDLREEIGLMNPRNYLIETNWNVARPNINSLIKNLGTDITITADDLIVTPYAGVDPNRIWNQFVTDMRSSCPANAYAKKNNFKRIVISHHLVTSATGRSWPAIHGYDTYALFGWPQDSWSAFYLPEPEGAERELEQTVLGMILDLNTSAIFSRGEDGAVVTTVLGDGEWPNDDTCKWLEDNGISRHSWMN